MTDLNTSDQTVTKTWGWTAPSGADPMNHWVRGEAIHGTGMFEMPIINHVKDNLYHGGYVDGIDLGDMFDSIVSLYQWEVYPTKGITYTYEMYDSGQVDIETVEDAAKQVQSCLDQGQKVLVHCQAGLNRSGIVVALVLMRQGMSADDAIALLRNSRSDQVLCNKRFENWLRAYETKGE